MIEYTTIDCRLLYISIISTIYNGITTTNLIKASIEFGHFPTASASAHRKVLDVGARPRRFGARITGFWRGAEGGGVGFPEPKGVGDDQHVEKPWRKPVKDTPCSLVLTMLYV